VNLSSVGGLDQSEKIPDRTPGRPRSVSARLKAFPCELECVVQLAWRCVSNPFNLHAGMELIRIAVFGKLLGNICQRAEFAESIRARRSPSVFCRGFARSPRAASNTAPCSTK
jgi:hypothetical protein